MAVVITGDIIASSKLALAERQEKVNQLICELFEMARTALADSSTRVEAIQGDAFQIYFTSDAEAVRIALLLKSFFLSQEKLDGGYRFDCRLSVGVGSVSFLHPVALAQSGGEVFEYSGRNLKDIQKNSSQLVFQSSHSAQVAVISMGLIMVDELMKRYTPSQSQAVFWKLTYPNQSQEWLASQVNISQSAYSQRLSQAGWPAIAALLEYYNTSVKLYQLNPSNTDD